jgi:hypothetical protein
MTRPSNQAIEHHYFEQFKVHYPIPVGHVVYGDKPDVIIQGEQIIGVEIASLYLADGADPSSEQTQRRFRQEVLKQAQELYLTAGGRAIELTVAFDPAHPIRDKNSVAFALANAAKSIDKLPAGPVKKTHFSQIRELWFIYYNPIEYPDPVWRTSQVHTVPRLSLDRLAEILDEKHRKLSGYSRCDAYWLLFVVDFADSAQDQDIAWPDPEATVASKFGKIIVYKPQFAQWVEVPIQNDG